ncbi:phosphoribosylanthranilate isomerase [uncultured Winogradskyella sp.]|uniref:phosphoribosylanthranilate isomerase n=1 Tax=uncultured Winogradskyella sp. TaxID=395353 RepID=UPI002603C15A|nr:phosphoribosylanthranilate isomerase [uncultured Winogradskyella sp.]
MKLKVCGMKYNIAEVAELHPDYLGFIFYKKSPRNFEDTIPELPKDIKKVGVFVDENIEVLVAKIDTCKLDAIQLHGHESPEYCLKLKRHYEEHSDLVISSKETDYHDFSKKSRNDNVLEIIKVFSIKDEFDFSVLSNYKDVCDYFLFDTKGKLPGGNGYTFNWDVLKDYPFTKPYFLSGGIGLNEIKKIKTFKESPASKYCYALDVNSKFEIEPGLKDIELLENFKSQLFT